MADDDNFLSRWSRRKARVRQGEAQVEPAEQPPAPTPAPTTVAATVTATTTATTATTAATLAPEVVAPSAAVEEPAPAAARERLPAPTLDDVALLDRESSYSRFVAPDVPAEVKNAALKKLFTDPHFNVMDGLDIYIEDYGQPDPLPASMLRQMASAHALGLFRDDSIPGPNAPRAAGSHLVDEAAAAGRLAAAAKEETPLPAADSGPEAAAEALPPPEPAHEDTDLRLQPNDAAGCAGTEPGAGEDPRRQH